MIIAFNYIRYLHIYPLYFMNAVKGTITRLRVTRARQQRERTLFLSSLSESLAQSYLPQSISITHHRYFKMINTFYLPLHKWMALLRSPHLSAQSIEKPPRKIYIEDVR